MKETFLNIAIPLKKTTRRQNLAENRHCHRSCLGIPEVMDIFEDTTYTISISKSFVLM